MIKLFVDSTCRAAMRTFDPDRFDVVEAKIIAESEIAPAVPIDAAAALEPVIFLLRHRAECGICRGNFDSLQTARRRLLTN